MTDFLKGFRRNDDGSWTCVARASYSGNDGTIQVMPGTIFTPGTSFLGVDLVGWLEMLERNANPPRHQLAA